MNADARELPLLARRGGCGKKNNREASTVPQTGWWFNKFLSNLDHHPVCACAFGYRRIHPSWPGGAIRAYQQLVHTFIDRTYNPDRRIQKKQTPIPLHDRSFPQTILSTAFGEPISYERNVCP